MLKKTIIVFVVFASIANNSVFPQAVSSESIPNETRAAEPIISSDSEHLSGNIINDENESAFFESYTIGERLGIGALNIFGGAGSIRRGGRTGWLVTGIQGVGLLSVLGGVVYGLSIVPPEQPAGANSVTNNQYQAAMERYEFSNSLRKGLITVGCVAIGTGVVVGFVIPFFHQKPDNTSVAQNNFPFNFELVSFNNQDINGLRISYNMRF